jgi:hypothetical protein
MPDQFDPPDREILASSIDAIAGMVAGLGDVVIATVAANEATCSFVPLIPLTCAVDMIQVKQASFALLGDLAKNLPQGLTPQSIGGLINGCTDHLTHHAPAVANNASWAIGEICVKAGEQQMAPYVERIVTALVSTLQNSQGGRAHVLVQNTCITIGRLALVSSKQMAPAFSKFAQQWCQIMINARNDSEKSNAFQGFCLLVQADSQVLMDGGNFFWFLKAVSAFYQDVQYASPPNPEVSQMIRQVIQGYKASHASSWPQIKTQLQPPELQRLQQMYQIGD